MRIFRALQDEKVHNVRAICTKEDIPKAFAYKILRELEQAGFVKSERGNQGGYLLNRKLDDLDRKSTRLNSSHITRSRMPSSA